MPGQLIFDFTFAPFLPGYAEAMQELAIDS